MDSSSEPDAADSSMEIALKRSLMPKNKLAVIVRSEEGTQFCCVECPMRYNSKEELEVHLCTHFKEFRFLCVICGTGLKRKEHLDRHTLGHQEVRPHICPECGKGFKRKEHLNIHLSIHTGDKTQVCPLCNRSFYRKDHLQKHLHTHNKMFMEQNIYPLSDQELMDIKQEVDYDEDVKPIISDEICDDNMEVDAENALSQLNVFPKRSLDPERPFACSACDKTYKRRDHLKLHTQSHLRKQKVCSECGKGFHREEQLLAHMSVHLRPYPAAQGGGADVAYIDHSDIDIVPLERAQAPAEAARPHACPQCHRRFKRKQHLKAHSNVHLRQQPPTIWCSRCHEGFHINSQFEQHQCLGPGGGGAAGGGEGPAPADAKKENNHPFEFVQLPGEAECQKAEEREARIPTPQRVFVCKFCGKPFKRKDHYKIHLHIHTGVKSFFCTDCGKGFYRKDHLQKHSQVHQRQQKPRPKREMPDLFPISLMAAKKEVRPEITITAPSNTKLRVPLQIKVPYQVVMSTEDGQQRSVTIDPQSGARLPIS